MSEISRLINDLEYAAFNLFSDSSQERRNRLENTVETTCPEGARLMVIRDLKRIESRANGGIIPVESGTNRYGVDIGYFRKTINRELNNSLENFRADELARAFARLSVTADSSVIKEPEFQ